MTTAHWANDLLEIWKMSPVDFAEFLGTIENQMTRNHLQEFYMKGPEIDELLETVKMNDEAWEERDDYDSVIWKATTTKDFDDSGLNKE